MAIPIIQPQTPNYAQWDWNPGATFLAAAKTTASMLDNIKQAEQMDRKLALDEKIKETMLPYEVLEAQAKIDHTKAQTALAASRSRALADGSQTAAILNGMGDLTTEQLYDIAGLGAPSETPPTRDSAPTAPSPIGGGDFKSIDLPAGPLQSFYQQDDDTDALTSIAGRLPDGSTMDELTNPKFSMASSSDSVSTDVAPRAAEMSVLKAKSLEPKVTNPLDWDENPAVTQTTTPQKATWSSDAEQELKGIRSKLGANPLESLPDVQAERTEGPSIGAYISKRYNDLQTVSQKARNSKGQDRKTLSAVAMALEGRIYQDVASTYGIDDPVVVQNLIKGPGGLRRTADEIQSIYGIMQDRSVEALDENGNLQQIPVTNWSEAFQAAELKRNSLKAALKTKKASEDDSIKQTQEFFNLAKSWEEAKSKSQENPEDKESQIVFQMLSNRLKTIGGEEYKQLEFGYNQEQYANMMQYSGQKVRPDGQPTEGLKDKTADQVRLELIKSGAIPVIEGVAGDNGISYDTDDLASKFPGGKLVEGAFVALRNPNAKSADQEFQTHRILNGRLAKLSSPSEPDKAQPKQEGSSTSEPEKTPNKSGKTVYDAARPYFQESPNSVAGRVVDRGMDAVLNAGDYAATAVRNRAIAPAAEFLAGAMGEDLDLGRTPNAKPQDRPKQLPEERIQIIERMTGGPLQSAGREIIRKKLNK
jgi:hypothetical protein